MAEATGNLYLDTDGVNEVYLYSGESVDVYWTTENATSAILYVDGVAKSTDLNGMLTLTADELGVGAHEVKLDASEIALFNGSFKLKTTKLGDFSILIQTDADSYTVDFGDGNLIEFPNVDKSAELTTTFADDSEKEVTVYINGAWANSSVFEISASDQDVTEIEFTDLLGLKSIDGSFTLDFEVNEIGTLIFDGFPNLESVGGITQIKFNDNSLSAVDLTPLSGLNSVSNLYLYFSNNQITDLQISGFNQIRDIPYLIIDFEDNTLNTASIIGFNSVETIGSLRILFSGNNLTSIDLVGFESLRLVAYFMNLFAKENNLTSLSFSGFDALERVGGDLWVLATNNSIQSLDYTAFANLASVGRLINDIDDNLITALDFTGFDSLTTASEVTNSFRNNPITSVNAKAFENLAEGTENSLALTNTEIVELNGDDIPNTTKLYVSDTPLERLLMPFSELEYLDINPNEVNVAQSLRETNLETFDASGNLNLRYADVRRNPNLKTIDISNTLISDVGKDSDNLYVTTDAIYGKQVDYNGNITSGYRTQLMKDKIAVEEGESIWVSATASEGVYFRFAIYREDGTFIVTKGYNQTYGSEMIMPEGSNYALCSCTAAANVQINKGASINNFELSMIDVCANATTSSTEKRKLDISTNANAETFRCNNNTAVETIDLSYNTALTTIEINDCPNLVSVVYPDGWTGLRWAKK